jgi:hypothetical protein
MNNSAIFMSNWQTRKPVHTFNPIPILAKLYSIKYSVIAKKRQYLAMKIAQMKKKAEENILIQKIQQNSLNTGDKVRSYFILYKLYNYDIDKILLTCHISKQTLYKYIKMGRLPEEVLELLDADNEKHISNDVAVELTKLPKDIDPMEVLNKISTLTNKQKIHAIKQWKPKS